MKENSANTLIHLSHHTSSKPTRERKGQQNTNVKCRKAHFDETSVANHLCVNEKPKHLFFSGFPKFNEVTVRDSYLQSLRDEYVDRQGSAHEHASLNAFSGILQVGYDQNYMKETLPCHAQ